MNMNYINVKNEIKEHKILILKLSLKNIMRVQQIIK